ncbi:MAG: hypothetical protein ACLP0J_29945 [Solirubrobacteraceae bacterium]
MTPAATVAGRAKATRQQLDGAARKTPLRRGRANAGAQRRGPANAGTQRSGPARTPKLSPRIPRRISGPSGGVDAGVSLPRPASDSGAAIRLPQVASTVAFLRALPDQRWLDRLVRSRWWIPVLGVMLTAVVGMQVEVLKSGVGTGRSINLAARLESRYQLLSASVAELDSPQRIEQVASQMGMVMAGPTSIQFVHASAPGSVRAPLSSISPPDSQSFMSALAAADGTSATAPAPASTAAAPSTAATTASGGAAPSAVG